MYKLFCFIFGGLFSPPFNTFINMPNNSINPFVGSMISAGANIGTNIMNNVLASREASKSRQWSEDMYKKYYSPLAQRNQMRAAGFNPLANESATQPLSMPSGATASPSSSSVPDFGQALLNKSAVDVNEALAEKYRAEANNQSGENYVLDNMDGGELDGKKYGTMRGYLKALQAKGLFTQNDLNVVNQNVGKSSVSLNDKKIEQLSAEITSINTKNDMLSFQQKLQTEYGISPDDDGIKAIVKIALLHPAKSEEIVRTLTRAMFSANVGFVKGVGDNWKTIFDMFGK